MRYQETGNVHMDFHVATNTTIQYIIENYGVDHLRDIFQKTGRDVYKDLRERLATGDTREMVRHWAYFFDREQAEYEITENSGEITLEVKRCPAISHIDKLGVELSPSFCDQTEYVNRGICEGTGYEIITRKTGRCSCLQTLRKREVSHDSQ